MKKSIIKDQRGFTLLEMMIVIVILGTLATLAIPKFTNSLALANTAKIQSDLQTINTSISMYLMQHGHYPQNLQTDLTEYIDDIDNLAPPQGECYLRSGEKLKITVNTYNLDNSLEFALCQNHPLKDFGSIQK